MSEAWPSCRCPAGRPSGHPRHAGCWKPDRATPNATPPRFPDHCAEHADVAVPGNCGDCKDTREANAWAAEQPPDYRLRVVPPLCGECDERWIETPRGLAKCPRCYPAEVAS